MERFYEMHEGRAVQGISGIGIVRSSAQGVDLFSLDFGITRVTNEGNFLWGVQYLNRPHGTIHRDPRDGTLTLDSQDLILLSISREDARKCKRSQLATKRFCADVCRDYATAY